MKKSIVLLGLIFSLFGNALLIPNGFAQFSTNRNLRDFPHFVLNGDADDDGFPLWKEIHYGTDPHNPDTDGDSLTDGGEDPDGPGGTDPTDPDTDDDSYCDGWEKSAGTIATDASSYPYWEGEGTGDGTCPSKVN